MILKIISVIRLLFLKIIHGKRLKMKSIRQFVRVDTEITIGKNASLSLDRVSTESNVHLLCDCGEMHIGSLVCFNRNCIVACRDRIEIGDKCLFGPNVCIYDHDHVYTVDGIIPLKFKCSEIVIEDSCWIGAGVIILRGTHIGRNSVIEAGSVVKGDIPPNSLVTRIKETRIIPTTLFMGNCRNL